jgi:hypothetical protein
MHVSVFRRMFELCTGTPLQDAPQTAQVRITFFFPALPSRRLPQSAQKMREPIADIVVAFYWRRRRVVRQKKVTGSRETLRGALPLLQA